MSRRRQTPIVLPQPSPPFCLTDLDPVDEEVFEPVTTPENLTTTIEDLIAEAQVPLPDDPLSRKAECPIKNSDAGFVP